MLALDELGNGFTGDPHSLFEIHSSPPGDAHIDGSDAGVEIHFRLRSRGVIGERSCRGQQQWQPQKWQGQ